MELNKNNLVCARPLERVGGFSSNLQGYFIGKTFRADGLGDLDLTFKVMVGLTMTSFSQIKLVCTVYQEYLFEFLPNLHRYCLSKFHSCLDFGGLDFICNENNEKFAQIKVVGVISRDSMLGFFSYKNSHQRRWQIPRLKAAWA